jgi:putative ABC transport system ATP-binding protein
MTPILEASALAKSYDAGGLQVLALRGVDLAVAEGELVAVIGPSGCGKSTLLHLLGGLDRPSAGSVRLRGERVDGLSETAWAVRRRREIGFVFQFFNLLPNLSAAENVDLPMQLVGASPAEARARREELLGELGLGAKGDALPGQLSGGEQQRVALARALANRPAVLLADEPTGNLDSASTADVLALLRRLREGGQTILLVTHDARVAASADRVVRMRDGLVVDDTRLGEPADPAAVLSGLLELGA